ncbi:MAG: PQQ-like beta-propeller repeat protein [Verrucomicrobia bacterium]|nr:PQQ-like beta-propeller repeat protein [Verrucomicrobiota bacterium]MBI3870534.1 PQQ-like beta-propeller repeat protein [Verrucomicrobiota bacterium]
MAAVPGRADDWPQWLGPQRDAEWRETKIVEKFPAEGLKPQWRAPIGGGYSGPAVAGGRVYVMDRQLPAGGKNPANPFDRAQIPGQERVLCLDASNGKMIWHHDYDCPYTVSYAAGPRVTPVAHEGKIYTLGTEGHLLALNATDGAVLWSHDFKKDFNIPTPLWGFAGHPLIDGDRVICLAGGTGSVAVAFHKDTGKELWRALSAKEPGYAPPVIYTYAGKRQLIFWHPESVNSLDPETGRVLWTYPTAPIRFGMTIPMPRQAGDLLFLTSFYNGSLMLRVGPEGPAKVWESRKISEKDTDGLHSVMSTPWIQDGYIYSPCSYGQFRCVNAATGDRLWETYEPTSGKSERWGHAFVVKNGSRWFLFSERGDLIIAKLSPGKYEEVSRSPLLEPTNRDPGRPVVWSHPAFANRSIYARNDREIVCVSLASP